MIFFKNNKGQTTLESAIATLTLLTLVSVLFCGLYIFYLKANLDHQAYEFLVCKAAYQQAVDCETKVKANIQNLLISSELKNFEFKKNKDELIVSFQIKIKSGIQLVIKRSLSIPLKAI